MQSYADLVHALSWRIAAELASCVPQSFIVELHPGTPSGEMSDELTVRKRAGGSVPRPGRLVASFNRTGSIRAAGLDLSWADVLRLGTVETTARLLKSAGVPAKRRPTSPLRRTYRIAAEILELRLPDPHQWAVRSAMLDTGGFGGGVQQPLLLGQPELAMADPYQVWTVLCDGVPVLAISGGSAFYPDGYRLTLMELQSTAEPQMADYLLRRVPGL